MATNSFLPELWEIPQAIRRRLGHRVGRQRAMFADGHLLLVLHAPPVPDGEERTARLFWRSPDGAWQSNKLGPGPKALAKHLDEYADAVETLDEAEERAAKADDYFALLRKIAPLHRAARNMHTTLQEARQTVPDDRDVLVGRDRAYEIERSAELLQRDTQSGLDWAVARNAERQAEHSQRMAAAGHRLNLMAAAFLPVATIASVFGMNLDPGFGDTFAPWPFWLAVLAGVLIGGLLRTSHSGKPKPLTTARRPSGRCRPGPIPG